MARGRGQIPPYGKHFRLESLPYHPSLANRAYILKRDDRWFIRSDKTSGVWTIFYIDPELSVSIAMGKPLPTFGLAMQRLLEGIDRGFYQAG
jgi:hypothetical protein